jgi:hypothetical protein
MTLKDRCYDIIVPDVYAPTENESEYKKDSFFFFSRNYSWYSINSRSTT